MKSENLILLETNPTTVLEWKHEPFEKFMGANESSVFYEVGISWPDLMTSSFYFAVRPNMVYQNQFNGEVFKGSTETDFRVGYRRDAPTVEYLFDLVDKATFEFAKIFHRRTQNTNLRFHQVPRPNIEHLREILQETIDRWDAPARKFKESGGMRLDRFKTFPVIPEHKCYNEESATTAEQRITFKLFKGRAANQEEETILKELQQFYEELNGKLAVLDYSIFTPQDFLDFRNYIHYAFNFHILVSNELEVTGELYRLVVNECVQHSNTPITDRKYLTYPTLEILKDIGKYNRASTWKSTVLYLTESIDTALKELRPPENKLITVGVWEPTGRRKFTSYPIEHNEEAAKVNSEVAQGRRAIDIVSARHHPIVAKYINNYFGLLAREYSKPIKHHYEYLLSAILSENIFELDDPNPTFRYECIVYPSVGNEFKTRNLAVKPNVADEHFKLSKVIEFEVAQANYDSAPLLTGNPASISVARIKNYRETKKIAENGDIEW